MPRRTTSSRTTVCIYIYISLNFRTSIQRKSRASHAPDRTRRTSEGRRSRLSTPRSAAAPCPPPPTPLTASRLRTRLREGRWPRTQTLERWGRGLRERQQQQCRARGFGMVGRERPLERQGGHYARATGFILWLGASLFKRVSSSPADTVSVLKVTYPPAGGTFVCERDVCLE